MLRFQGSRFDLTSHKFSIVYSLACVAISCCHLPLANPLLFHKVGGGEGSWSKSPCEFIPSLSGNCMYATWLSMFSVATRCSTTLGKTGKYLNNRLQEIVIFNALMPMITMTNNKPTLIELIKISQWDVLLLKVHRNTEWHSLGEIGNDRIYENKLNFQARNKMTQKVNNFTGRQKSYWGEKKVCIVHRNIAEWL